MTTKATVSFDSISSGQGRSLRVASKVAGLLAVLASTSACSDPAAMKPEPEASFSVRGSVEQVHVWKAPPMAKIELHDSTGALVQEGVADEQGSLVLRNVPPGNDYEVVVPELVELNTVKPVRVMSVEGSLPNPEFYSSQKFVAGFNYITMRDGTKLAAYITLPGPPENGPYPTVVNYSGYNPAQPGAPIGNYSFLCGDLPILCDAPNDASAIIAGLNGYATVGVNMRGTGCSGGAYDYFETLQSLDGYDIIEAVAAQDWVLHHKVGMTGLSYPGITQLFVARTRPPSLAAITPLSVIGGTHTTMRPGGIFNDGFALEWITGVLDKAAPYGQGWEQARVDAGDTVCQENQLLHSQRANVIDTAQATAYYTDDLVKPLDPTAFVNEIDIPVFLASSFQDEQTGPYFFTLLDQFKSSPLTRFTVYNGIHPDAFAPQVLVEWKAFLDIYVAQTVPSVSKQVRELAPILFETIFKAKSELPPDRFANHATWEDAKKAYEAEGSLRAIFDNGAAETPGAPEGTAELRFGAWPPPTTPTRYFFQSDGSLEPTEPVEMAGASSFVLDVDAGHRGIIAPGGDVWDPLPAYDWRQPGADKAVVFDSAPLATDLVMLGTGSVDIWLRSSVDDADIEVNLSEIRPDGQEMFVQSGWLRASVRKLDGSSTELWPQPTYREADAAPLVPGEWTSMRIGIASFGHVFRAGSRIRIGIDTPGDSRARWTFDLKQFSGEARHDVAHSAMYPSSVVLPVIAGETAQTPLPPCPSLRGQQCRPYAAYTNTPAMP
ncbi:MAG: CocE/NonD family hydrolase [Polyangiaceae bacterium]|nr:CocE/NonD family hydrolase [Polyangiaceae bacterium]